MSDKKRDLQNDSEFIEAICSRARTGDFVNDPETLALIIEHSGETIAHFQVVWGWKTEDPEILKLKDRKGRTVAQAQVSKGWITNDPYFLKMDSDKKGFPIAHYQALKGWGTKDKELLKLKNAYGDTLAHIQKNSNDIEILRLKNDNGMTVAEGQVNSGWKSKELEVLKMKDRNDCPLALRMISKDIRYYINIELSEKKTDFLRIGKHIRENVKRHLEWMKDEEIGWVIEDKEALALSGPNGITVAHLQVYQGWISEDIDVLSLKDDKGIPVALLQASKGWSTEDEDILKLSDNEGVSVAHVQASLGWTTDNIDILKLKTKSGWSVAHEQAMLLWKATDPEVLAITDGEGRTVAQTMEYRESKRTIRMLEELEKELEKPVLEKAKVPWSGAKLIVTDRKPEKEDKESFFSSPRYVVTEHVLEVSRFVRDIGEAFFAEGRIDGSNKRDFFGRLGNTLNRCLDTMSRPSAKMLCAATLHETFAIYDETEGEGFVSATVIPSGMVADDFMPHDKRVRGYINNRDTINFFRSRGIDLGERDYIKMREDTLYYFAYGSNINTKQMEERLNKYHWYQVATLSGYELAFNKRSIDTTGKANIMSKEGSIVWGVLFAVKPEDIEILDRHEGANNGHYRRERIDVEVSNGRIYEAYTYIAEEVRIDPTIRPSEQYLSTILIGAKRHRFPKEYIKRIEEA